MNSRGFRGILKSYHLYLGHLREGWLHETTRILIGAQVGSLDKLLVRLDEASGFSQLPSDEEALAILKKKDFIHIKP